MNNIIVGVMAVLIIGTVIVAMVVSRGKDDENENQEDKKEDK